VTKEIENSTDLISRNTAEQNEDFDWLHEQSPDDLRLYQEFEQKSLLSQRSVFQPRDKETTALILGQLALIGKVVDKRDLG
jgi:hypothetical protein